MIRLVLKDSEGGEASCPVLGELVIGRGVECHIRLDNPGVSRKHARVHSENDIHFIEDLKTSNGTIVNGKRIEGMTEIRMGDLIVLAGEKIRVFDLPAFKAISDAETTHSHILDKMPDEKDETGDPVKKAWQSPLESRAALLRTEKYSVDYAAIDELKSKAEGKKKVVFALATGGALLIIGTLLFLLVKS